MELPFVVATLTRRGLLTPGRPIRVASQLSALRTWGWSLAGELRQAAARDPDRIAIIDDQGTQLTYAELLDRCLRLARALRAGLGVAPGDRIGVFGRNHPGLVETIVAATLLGADAVLINTGLSPAQLTTVAQEQQLRVLVHDDEFAERILGLPADLRRLDERAREELIRTALPGELQPPSGTAGSSCSPPAPPERRRAPAAPPPPGSVRWSPSSTGSRCTSGTG